MSDHLIAEAHRHAMALPTTHPTHADIAWYVREVSGLRAELALLREWQREVIQNANAHHAERKDAIARAESAEREAFDWKKIARYETARAERAEAELKAEQDNSAINEIKLRVSRAIVSKIWVQLGSPTYEQLKGRSIYDLIDELKAELAAERARMADLVADLNDACITLESAENDCDDYAMQNTAFKLMAVRNVLLQYIPNAAMKEGAK